MAESIEERLDKAEAIAGDRDPLWNERFRAGLRNHGLRIGGADEAGETAVGAPACEPKASYGWVSESVIVERDRA